MAEIKKIMEWDSALKIIDEIKNKIGGVDLDAICGEKVEISETKEDDNTFKRLVQCVMVGKVYWDDEKQCLVQELLQPVKSGDVELDTLYYKNKLRLKDGKNFKAKNQAQLTIESLATACCRPPQVIEQITGTDIIIAMGCLSFFDK